jgi:UPF0176 protein
MTNYQVLLFYKYVTIENPTELMDQQRALWEQLGFKGRMIIASEGLNGTLEGSVEQVSEYIREMQKDERFSDIHWKKSAGSGETFPKISIKVRDEIVSLHLGQDDFSPYEATGKYLSAEELHQWFQEKKEFYIIDMRNDYEFKVGHFQGSINPSFKNFRDLPKILPEIEGYKDKTVLTVCTGGIRCEKASGYLVRNGFKDVYQLQGGIHTYMEKYPNQDFLGKLYVFDGRIVMGYNTDSPEHVSIGKCDLCEVDCESFADYFLNGTERKHGILCPVCRQKDEVVVDPGF